MAENVELRVSRTHFPPSFLESSEMRDSTYGAFVVKLIKVDLHHVFCESVIVSSPYPNVYIVIPRPICN